MLTGRSVAFPGHPLGSGLTPTAAKARNFVLKKLISSGAPLRSINREIHLFRYKNAKTSLLCGAWRVVLLILDTFLSLIFFKSDFCIGTRSGGRNPCWNFSH